ncbi:MAG: type IV conjugative transfer system lipoprotein TraV [Sulfuricaulis sp.]
MNIRILTIAAGILFLGGCSFSGLSGSSQFACKAPAGVSCNSVSGVYANSIEDNLPSQRNDKKKMDDDDKNSYFQDGVDRPRAVNASVIVPGGVSQDGAPDYMPLRSQPKVIRIWVAPYTGADDEYHDQSYVYTVVDDGRWLVEPGNEKIRAKYAPSPNVKTSATKTTDQAVATRGGPHP